MELYNGHSANLFAHTFKYDMFECLTHYNTLTFFNPFDTHLTCLTSNIENKTSKLMNQFAEPTSWTVNSKIVLIKTFYSWAIWDLLLNSILTLINIQMHRSIHKHLDTLVLHVARKYEMINLKFYHLLPIRTDSFHDLCKSLNTFFVLDNIIL